MKGKQNQLTSRFLFSPLSLSPPCRHVMLSPFFFFSLSTVRLVSCDDEPLFLFFLNFEFINHLRLLSSLPRPSHSSLASNGRRVRVMRAR